MRLQEIPMKIALFTLISTLALASTAKADGFVCTADASGAVIRVYNHVSASEGTRSPAILVVSDPSLAAGQQTLATFSSDRQNLQYGGNGLYTALLQNADYVKTGTLAGMRLRNLTSISLAVVFNYSTDSTTLADSVAEIPATLRLQARDGTIVQEEATCTRYLKNPKNPKSSLSTN